MCKYMILFTVGSVETGGCSSPPHWFGFTMVIFTFERINQRLPLNDFYFEVMKILAL